MADSLRVLIVSEHASARFGGEAALPLHYFRVLRKRGHDVWLITHARTRDELVQLYPDEKRIHYVEDSRLHRLMWQIGRRLPGDISSYTTKFVSRFAAQLTQRTLVRRLIATEGIEIIHQPMPVSPREPSMMFGFGVPVVIGPLNGGMDYPAAFRNYRGVIERITLRLGRWSAALLNWLIPGKRHAALLLVANSRTQDALPAGICGKVVEVVENAVDLSLWRPAPAVDPGKDARQEVTTFIFVGRLINWKAVDLLLHAFKLAASQVAIRLLIVGDGTERQRLEALANELGIQAAAHGRSQGVFFAGWMSQKECADQLQRADCLVLPSLWECGGAVVLEAMSMAKPVIATAWGGPQDYLDETCGILVPPVDRESLTRGFADAMVRLSESEATRLRLGRNGRQKVLQQYDWEVKVDRMLELYAQACAGKTRNRSDALRAP